MEQGAGMAKREETIESKSRRRKVARDHRKLDAPSPAKLVRRAADKLLTPMDDEEEEPMPPVSAAEEVGTARLDDEDDAAAEDSESVIPARNG
jgi:hypothetical protein